MSISTSIHNSTSTIQRCLSYAWLSIGVSVLTILLKTVAWFLTGSVGLLSDAMESLVNLVGAIMALAMLHVASRPEDEDHAYGHGKAEYFSAGLEGILILVAALLIAWAAIERLLAPRELERLGLGLGVSVLASLLNLGAALILLRAGKIHDSITLRADARHLLTDVWTSAGVLLGVGLVNVTGWLWLDPVAALVVAVQIVWTGVSILRETINGLMDIALSSEEVVALKDILHKYCLEGLEYRELRTRRAGARQFISFHLLVPGHWSVQKSHEITECVEKEIYQTMPNASVFIHVEPLKMA
ncbi:MAG: cation diffusion facilitator family transporter [Dissulfuribacterales bacterium]